MGVSIVMGIPQNEWFMMEIPSKRDDVEVPLFQDFPCPGVCMYMWVFLQVFRLRLGPLVTANKMQPTNPNAHTYVNGTDAETHGYAVTQNTFLKQFT